MIHKTKHIHIYNFLISLFEKTQSDKAKLSLSSFISSFADWNFVGKLREPVLEDFFAEYHSKLKLNSSVSRKKKSKKENFVHVFTKTYESGGHSRLAENFISLDNERIHHLIVTDQGDTAPNQILEKVVKNSNGEILYINEEKIEQKIETLLSFVLDHADKVILHVHSNDYIPSIALNGLKNSMEIIFLNHADSAFSFGVDIASKVINIREEAHKMTVHLRNIENSFILPLPIIKKQFSDTEVNSIKTKYLDKNDQIIGLSIGSFYKFHPNYTHDFFKTWTQALNQNPKLQLWIVGLTIENYYLIYTIKPHSRIRFFGVMNDPTELQLIADIIVDPMPIGSYTALLETSFYGAYPLTCYNAIPLFDLTQDPSFKGKINLDLIEKSYLNHIQNICLGNVNLNRQQIRERIQYYHSGENWCIKLNEILNAKNGNFAEKPTEPKRLEELNQTIEEINKRLLVYIYSNIKLFSFREQINIICFLALNKFKIREILGIVKKIIVN